MLIRSHWKPKYKSEFVTDSEGREFQIGTFEGGRKGLDLSLPPTPWKAVAMGREVRASVFLRGGTVQFTVDTVAELSHMEAAFDAVRSEARRLVTEGKWELGGAYNLS